MVQRAGLRDHAALNPQLLNRLAMVLGAERFPDWVPFSPPHGSLRALGRGDGRRDS